MSRRSGGRPVLAREAGRGLAWRRVIPAIVLGAVLFLLAAPAAMAHGGIESGQSPWTAWNTNPLPTILLLMAAYFYMNGLANWDRPSHPVNNWQKLSFFSGLFLIFIALQSPLDPIADHMLSAHQVQHFLLRMMAPLLILLGAPLTPMLRGLPPWALKRIVKPLVRHTRVRRAYFWLTNPIVTTGLFMGSLYLWQFPGAFNLALRSDVVHALMHLTMSGSGFLFWWIVIDPKPHHSRLHYGLRVLYLGLIVLPNTILGAAITFSDGLLYSAYAEVRQPFGVSLLTDQQMGGLMLWVPGDMMSVIAAGVVMVMWYNKEEGQNNAESPVR